MTASLCRLQRTLSDDYAAEVKAALDLWDGTGGFVFTSSTAVYNGTDGEPCDEKTPEFKMGENPRADRLLEARGCGSTSANGCVVRLSGLYHSKRGAHMYFLKGSHVELQRGRARKPRALRGRGGGGGGRAQVAAGWA